MTEYTYDLGNDLKNSERCVAIILSLCLQFGVRKRDISFGDINLIDQKIDPSLFSASINWLVSEGFIRAEGPIVTVREDGYLDPTGQAGCVLTTKGFAALGHALPGSKNGETVGEHATKIAASMGDLNRAGTFLGSLLGGFTKSIG